MGATLYLCLKQMENTRMTNEKTNIQVKRSTRDRLAELGSKKDTYDDIINRLIEHYEQS